MAAPNGSVEQLEKLAQLKEKGVISKEEFDAKKKEILSANFGAQESPVKRKKGFPYIKAFLLVVALGIVGVFFASKSASEGDVDTIIKAESAAIQPEGELSDLFTMGSDYTDVQRENKIAEIKGKVVTWRLPVYEVSRAGNEYVLMTQGSMKLGPIGRNLLQAHVKISPRSEEERKYLESLKTGDMVTFKGRIAYALATRTLRINPAIVVMQGPIPAPQVAPAQAPASPAKAEAPVASVPQGQTEPLSETAAFSADCQAFRSEIAKTSGGMSDVDAKNNAAATCQDEEKAFAACRQGGKRSRLDCANNASPTGEGEFEGRWARLQRVAQ